jgi:hypothetical protein
MACRSVSSNKAYAAALWVLDSFLPKTPQQPCTILLLPDKPLLLVFFAGDNRIKLQHLNLYLQMPRQWPGTMPPPGGLSEAQHTSVAVRTTLHTTHHDFPALCCTRPSLLTTCQLSNSSNAASDAACSQASLLAGI